MRLAKKTTCRRKNGISLKDDISHVTSKKGHSRANGRERKRMDEKNNSEIYAVDFDGTLHNGKWPGIGEPNAELINFLNRVQAAGDKVIMWTCREGKMLKKAVKWCKKQGIIFDEVNKNDKSNIKKFGSDSRKIFAHHYIDDRNLEIGRIVKNNKTNECKMWNGPWSSFV